MSLRFASCRMDGCRCGAPHPAYTDCNACRGHGHVIGGDAYQHCPSCSLRFRRDYGVFVDALAENPLPLDDEAWLADEAAERAWKSR